MNAKLQQLDPWRFEIPREGDMRVPGLVYASAAMIEDIRQDASLQQVLESAPVQQHFQKVLNQLAAQATGSATRVARMHLMAEPPSLDKGEITDKGSINQRAVLKHRANLVEAMHEGKLPFTLVPQQ